MEGGEGWRVGRGGGWGGVEGGEGWRVGSRKVAGYSGALNFLTQGEMAHKEAALHSNCHKT